MSEQVTYPLHIVLRYELERGLLDGTIEVDDIPRLWNERMEAYLGCTPPDDAQVRCVRCPTRRAQKRSAYCHPLTHSVLYHNGYV